MGYKIKYFLITFFLGMFGIHRFVRRQYALGILYLLTGGIFFIGWLVDVIIAFTLLFERDSPEMYSQSSNVFIPEHKIDLLQWQMLIMPGTNKLVMSPSQLAALTNDALLQHSRIADDCQQLIRSTTNIETFFSRYDLLIEKLSFLCRLEKYLPIGHPASHQSELCMQEYVMNKQRYIIALIDRCWNAAIVKADGLKTEKGKKNQFAKLISDLDKYKHHMTIETVNYYQNKYYNRYPDDETKHSPDCINEFENIPLSQGYDSVLILDEQAQSDLDDYRDSGVEEYQIICTYDNGTCNRCGQMDMKVYPVNEAKIGINYPPFHDGCRCITVPYYNDEDFKSETKVARDANGKSIYIPAAMNFSKYKKQYLNN